MIKHKTPLLEVAQSCFAIKTRESPNIFREIMPYINTDIDPSWYYADDYKTLMNVQVEIVETIAWLSQQPPTKTKETGLELVETLNSIINKLMDLKNTHQMCQMWLGEEQ